MSTRTPPLQPRSRFHRNWGNFADPGSTLPNQAGNVLAAAVHAVLEVGDTAWSSGTLYTCLNVGTAGGGDAVWWDAAQAAMLMQRGFAVGATAADKRYWSRVGLGDPLAGETAWSLGVIWQATTLSNGADQPLFGTAPHPALGLRGWRVAWAGGLIHFYWIDSGGTLRNISSFGADYNNKTLYLIVRYFDGFAEAWINGTFIGNFSGPAGAITAGSDLAVGTDAGAVAEVTTEAAVHGGWVLPGTSISNQEVFDFAREAFARGVLVQPPGFSDPAFELWRATDGNPAGGVWVASEGANDLTEIGTGGSGLVSVYEPRLWSPR